MSESGILALVVIALLVVLIVIVMQRQPGGQPAPTVKTILLAVAVALFILTGLGIVPGLTWGLACFAAAFIF
jgi:hypothetical protein